MAAKATSKQSLGSIRRRRLLTIRELAERSGCSKATIVDIEHGRRRPQPGTMRRLSEALGVDPELIAEFAAVLDASEWLPRSPDPEDVDATPRGSIGAFEPITDSAVERATTAE